MTADSGQRLRRAREREGLTQSALAKKIGCTQGSITGWEAGREPSLQYKRPLEDVLGPIFGQATEQQVDQTIDEVSSFGTWLRQQRLLADLSVPELSDKSGISAPAIYNIESGKSQNPQAGTRNRLADALGLSVPKQVVEDTIEQQSVQGLGPLIDFQPHDQSDWPSVAGVYVFYDISQRPVYVGKATNISQRLAFHEDRFWFKRPIVEYASYIEVPERELRHQLEQALIKFLKSNAVINRQSAESFASD